MAADKSEVNSSSTRSEGPLDADTHGFREPDVAQPGITVAELIAKVGNLEMPGGGFADALEAVQAEQGLAEMPEWPD